MSADVLALLYADPIRFARVVLPEWFPSKMPWVHRGIVALLLERTDFLLNFGEEDWPSGKGTWTPEDLDAIAKHFLYQPDPGNDAVPALPLFQVERDPQGVPVAVHMLSSRFMQVVLPRGMSKTTLFNFVNLFKIAYQLTKFTVYISESAGHAERQLGNIKRVMEGNETFRALFGNLVPDRNDPLKWTEDLIEIRNGVVVQAKGRGSQIRGANVNARRPDTILLDDVEDKEAVRTAEQREKTVSWLMGDVRPALPRHSGRVIALGTILHAEALLPQLAKTPDWVSVRFGALLGEEPLWPWYMTPAQWKRERASYQRLGKLSQFYMEYQSVIHVDEGDRRFNTAAWRIAPRPRADFRAVAIACDPAISEDRRADAAVIAVVGMTEAGEIQVLDLWGKKGASPRELVDQYFAMHFQWYADFHGVESIAYQRALIHLLKEEMHRKSQAHGNRAYFAVQGLTHGRVGKVERIEGVLAPRYAAGYITHSRHFPALWDEALDWPNGKKDHLDAVAMAITLLDPVAGLAAPVREIELSRQDWLEVNDAAQVCP